MATAIICLVLIVIAIYSVKSYMKKMSGGCCGGSAGPVEKRVKVKDRNASNYTYHKKLYVTGMICGNCAKRVENALNSMDGVWAVANVSENTVDVRMKQDLDDEMLKKTLKQAGYTMLSAEAL